MESGGGSSLLEHCLQAAEPGVGGLCQGGQPCHYGRGVSPAPPLEDKNDHQFKSATLFQETGAAQHGMQVCLT